MRLDSFVERQGVLLYQRSGAANLGLTPVRAEAAGVDDDVWRHAVVGVDDGAVDLDRAIEGGGGTMLATRALKPLSGASPATAWPALPLAPVMVTVFRLDYTPLSVPGAARAAWGCGGCRMPGNAPARRGCPVRE